MIFSWLLCGSLSVSSTALRDELVEAFPGLLPETVELNEWINEVEGYPARGLTTRGSVGMGNGHVFCLQGVGFPVNSLHGMLGPTYQKREGYFCDASTHLIVHGERVAFDRQWCGRIRESAVAFTKGTYKDLVLWTLDFVPAGPVPSWAETSLIRLVCVENFDEDPLEDLAVSMVLASRRNLRREKDRILEVKGSRTRSMRWIGAPYDVGQDHLTSALGELNGAPRAWRIFFFQIHDSSEREIPPTLPELDLTQIASLLQATLEYWERPHRLMLRTPEPRVDDLVESLTHCILVQQSAQGAVSPMSLYTSTWLRDTMGPVLGLLGMGSFEQVREMILYQIRAIKTDGTVKNARNCDVAYPEGAETLSWKPGDFMPGRVPAEAPSYLPLMMFHYVRATGDVSFLEDAFPILVHCLSQQIVDEGRIPFSGDETFRAALSSHFGLPVEYPFEKEAWSANSAFLFVAGVQALRELALSTESHQDMGNLIAMAQKVRERTESLFWDEEGAYYIPYILRNEEKAPGPYIDVNGKVLWCGYLGFEDTRAYENMNACISMLSSEPGIYHGKIHPRFSWLGRLLHASSIHTGMSYGYALSSLARLDHPQAEASFRAMLNHALGTGVFAEYMIDPGPNALTLGYDVTGQIMDYTARYRPWEGGINLAALLDYLIGFEPHALERSASFALHLPSNWSGFEFDGLRMGQTRFSGSLEGSSENRTLRLRQEGPDRIRVSIRLSLPTEDPVLVTAEEKIIPASRIVTRGGVTSVWIEDFSLESDHEATVGISAP